MPEHNGAHCAISQVLKRPAEGNPVGINRKAAYFFVKFNEQIHCLRDMLVQNL